MCFSFTNRTTPVNTVRAVTILNTVWISSSLLIDWFFIWGFQRSMAYQAGLLNMGIVMSNGDDPECETDCDEQVTKYTGMCDKALLQPTGSDWWPDKTAGVWLNAHNTSTHIDAQASKVNSWLGRHSQKIVCYHLTILPVWAMITSVVVWIRYTAIVFFCLKLRCGVVITWSIVTQILTHSSLFCEYNIWRIFCLILLLPHVY